MRSGDLRSILARPADLQRAHALTQFRNALGFRGVGGHVYVIEAATFSPDGTRFVAGDLVGWLVVHEQRGGGAGGDYTLRVWSVAD